MCYVVPRDCYNSYFYVVEDESLNVIDKFRLLRFLNKSLILETETLLLAAIQITESEKFDIVPAGAFKISIQTFPYMSVQVIF